ncbi:ATP-binding protein [Noviherbaspirillum galbum]|uniref:histidine kinase n=1 Tax=Noviherbaspirillum galbum TaxID=2709383 RepID=A0A6B3SF36_9BURK|nr:ATP-binding protein [Noviherbaspirillum galbum]NEX59454.1 response regulator [Noviherbaspirillum galbum]
MRILSVVINNELDVVASRQRARQIAELCGFASQEQTRIATAVSELARNVYNYASSGRVDFSIEGATVPQLLVITIADQGPGIAHLDLILSGRYQSTTGMGLGIIGARRLMDQFDIRTGAGQGTTILLKKLLPAHAPLLGSRQVGELGARLAVPPGANLTLAELQQQNQELLQTLSELRAKQDELMQLTRELEDTNRGVVALYAELDEKADHLRRADDMKSRFLSNMSHEFRTPLSSIRALSKLLLDRIDGDLSAEQEKQIVFILKQTEALSELVNDLLDLAKIEAGKTEVRPAEFDVGEMFSALRGMLRPLLVSERVDLVFDDPAAGLVMETDEAKVSQILRNFISNALKFTEAGEVRVRAELVDGDQAVRFSVRDTGLGIAPENQQIIFEEFGQVENRLQKKFKGTGLGLPLCRKLASLLGGRIHLESAIGAGSTFYVSLPLRYRAPEEETGVRVPAPAVPDDGRSPVLVVEDSQQMQMLYEKYLADTAFRPLIVRSTWEADRVLEQSSPAAIVLDIHLGSEDSWSWLNRLKSDGTHGRTPVIVITEIDDKAKGLALGADAYFIKPVFREELLAMLERLTAPYGRDAASKPGKHGMAKGTDQ